MPDDNVVSLADPVPQPNDSNPDNDYDDLATIGIAVAKAFVGSWASVALTGIKVILSREVGDPINFDRDTVGSGERFTWSYLLDGSSGMDGIPTSREETAGVRASLLNRNLGSGDFSDVTVNSSFTFRYPSLGGYCPCEDFVYVNETSENSFIELVEG
ncbi:MULTISPECIES: hypothetical protein [unclassified Haloferax]|uniref:hypothetical protein n=1 Tax=unclassified Haloferax TaxID=2625095 RepID=UPI0028764438|nr:MULTISPECIES: hypothetical protein [unclassified Haloferax]MDS0243907.1 hypothetical protein [Haloferax sp. S2CR25]MDS0447028.1 hypothetical protein [Haloferax sp. S2CR25-2]